MDGYALKVRTDLTTLNNLIEDYNNIITKIRDNPDYSFDEKLSGEFKSWSDILNLSWQTEGAESAKEEFDNTFYNLATDITHVNSELGKLEEVQKITLDI